MGPLPNLIYYSSIATSSFQIIAEYVDGSDELPSVASKCLQLIPPFHSSFSYTTNGRMFACIIDGSFRFCSIVDEGLPRSKAMSFLEEIRQEFHIHLGTSRMGSGSNRIVAYSDLGLIIRQAAAPYSGIPQKERARLLEEESQAQHAGEDGFEIASGAAYDDYDLLGSLEEKFTGSRSPSTPLIGKTNSNKYKQMNSKDQAVESDKAQSMEIMSDGMGHPLPIGGSQSQKAACSGHQMAKQVWWKNVKLVLTLDAIICLILFGIWLGVCHGFSCMRPPLGS